ncbi:TIM barrel protein [Rhodobacteraceae bacterium D3-12]|nr:TIM barrel protein [Rhodobacteraceae bacterium D3-12]
MKFSANLGFLWAELALPEAIAAAGAAGFDAVECHWPYDVPAEEVAAALGAAGFEMVGLNTRRGDVAAGENGLAALPGREEEARAAIREAVEYAAAIGARNVHVMAGNASGAAAEATFIENLRFASTLGRAAGVGILIEPLNQYDAPGYFLSTTRQAEAVIAAVGAQVLRLMFDCYHVQLMEGDVMNRLTRLLPIIGHIQFAAVPDRGAPDHGELNYPWLFEQIAALGYDAPLGAEYRPGGATAASLGWLARARGETRGG